MKKIKYFIIGILLFLLIAINLLYPGYSNSINTAFAGLLFLVTFLYVMLTQDILNEQVNSRKIGSIDKLLEDVYSPINNAFMEFYQELSHVDSLPDDNIPVNFKDGFEKLHANLMRINRNYGHLFDDDIKAAYKKVWNSWQRYSTLPHLQVGEKLFDYRELKSDIINFHKLLDTKIKERMKMRIYLLQQ